MKVYTVFMVEKDKRETMMGIFTTNQKVNEYIRKCKEYKILEDNFYVVISELDDGILI